jgi:glutathione S-transferase
MMKLHWSPRSPYVRKVMIVAHELGLADRIETVRTVVGGMTPHLALMRDNPLGKIPTLVLEDDTVLYDSPAGVVARHVQCTTIGRGHPGDR